MSLFGNLRAVPFAFFRSGTSRGLYLLEKDVPAAGPARDKLLCALMGSGHPQQLGGFGGSHGPTSKAVVVGPGREPGSVTYAFAQCLVEEAAVDHSHGDCGNMLAAVAPFALERGLVQASHEPATRSKVTIHSLNTGSCYVAEVMATAASEADAAMVTYEGSCEIPGIPGLAAPVRLSTLGVAGAQTGKLLPTGRQVDRFDLGDGLGSAATTVVDFARALVVVQANDVLPKFGYKSLDEVTEESTAADTKLCAALERVRLAAGLAAGMGDCTGKVAPKLALVASHEQQVAGAAGGALACRYFVHPGTKELHPTVAMTAAQALGAACLLQGSVAAEALGRPPQHDEGEEDNFSFTIAHPKGLFPVSIGTAAAESQAEHRNFPMGVPCSGRYTTTVMPIADGRAFAPQ